MPDDAGDDRGGPGPRRAEFGVDLLLDLRGAPGRKALGDALRAAARDGRLHAGAVLPSTRTLASELGLARNTVAAAYEQLVAEGWLISRQGSGTRVADHPALGAGLPARGRDPDGSARLRFDFTPGTPDLSRFPRERWQRAARRALARAPHGALSYPDPRGLPGLREALAEYLARARGVRADAEHIVICSGFTQALHLLAGVLRSRDATRIAVEDHGLPRHRRVIAAAGLDTTAVPVDREGARVDLLAGEDAVLLTPAHQFPLGVALSSRRRLGVLRWARRTGALLIEDDYDGEFRYDRQPVAALQADAPDLVAYAGTASKSLAPGLGLAWLVCPPGLLSDVVRAKEVSDGHTGVFEQLTLEEFLRCGDYDQHVRRARLAYRRRRNDLLAMLTDRSLPAVPRGIGAGLHVLIDLPARSAEAETTVVRAATRHDIALTGLSHYRTPPDPDASVAALVIGYTRPPGHGYRAALDALGGFLTTALAR
ncbi:PLP-dependent aminotransferase family protein [Actinomycetospora sp. NBRC 106378]|uniref:MocR-like pyridoxine biosynthesis transcription factor PdxR n=1 Tax=Actinomycetospora sp. NBRC 106378 TaxID=3032208 RepID=UPI0024A13C2C|nr:PLP-dependent aminotransferase family protein [Actinomycetospora sp. NBRC 106378]GLZ53403.1 GntR family transcriptional regulator [Actinomycetospora sp. NBRC 106378]